jgi:hypothetical protein
MLRSTLRLERLEDRDAPSGLDPDPTGTGGTPPPDTTGSVSPPSPTSGSGG